MNLIQREFLDRATADAAKCQHPFPPMAACEAALESSWGRSEIAREGNNLFGTKQHAHPIYGTMTLPTREFEAHLATGDGSGWEVVSAQWVKYPDWPSSFADRLATLQRLSNAYPHYKAALEATDAHTYIVEVSKTWSTDPARAAKVLDVYNEFTQPF